MQHNENEKKSDKAEKRVKTTTMAWISSKFSWIILALISLDYVPFVHHSNPSFVDLPMITCEVHLSINMNFTCHLATEHPLDWC